MAVNRNAMPLPTSLRATGTHGLPWLTQAPTLEKLAASYGASDASSAAAHRPFMASGHTHPSHSSSIGSGRLGSVLETSHGAAAKPKPVMRKAFEAEDVDLFRQQTIGKAIRHDAIPAGSELEYLAPGRVKFDGVEFRAVRDLEHLSEAELKEMAKKGKAFSDIHGDPMHGHHYQQLDHRHPDGFIVEIPRPNHSKANKVQHPKPDGDGLPEAARKEWNNVLREAYYKERARTELLRRGLVE